MVQKAALAAGISSRDLSAVLALQAALAEAGWSAKEVSAAFGTIASNGGDLKQARNCRVTILHGNNLPLTWFRQFRQFLGRYCSYLLPRQDGGTFQIQVNGRF